MCEAAPFLKIWTKSSEIYSFLHSKQNQVGTSDANTMSKALIHILCATMKLTPETVAIFPVLIEVTRDNS